MSAAIQSFQNGTSDLSVTSAGPLSPPEPQITPAILGPEAIALKTCLQNIVVKMGRIYQFSTRTRQLGIQAHYPKPLSLMSELRREILRYDQVVDRIEVQLLRAIFVLRQELLREDQRIREAEKTTKVTETQSDPRVVSPVSSVFAEPAQDSTEPPRETSSGPVARSAISISSLHRPTLPLKLELPSSSLPFNSEESNIFSSTITSPVTIAPKSARATFSNEYPQNLMALVSSTTTTQRPVDIDLTIPEPGGKKLFQVGNSAEKPIELDAGTMDIDGMTDLFGSPRTDLFVEKDMTPDMSSPVYLDDSLPDNHNSMKAETVDGAGLPFDINSLDFTRILETSTAEMDQLLMEAASDRGGDMS